MRKKLAATLLTLTAIMASMPTTAFASTETVNPAEKDSLQYQSVSSFSTVFLC